MRERSVDEYAGNAIGASSPPARLGFVLDCDPDLGSALGAEDWAAAQRACRGELVRAPRGRWTTPVDLAERETIIGFLVVAGIMCREVQLRDRHLLELLGPGDILEVPIGGEGPRLGGDIVLTAALTSDLLALGQTFITAASRWPSVLVAVHRRLEAQREHLAVQGLISHFPRVEHRLLLVLWHLADRWGRVTPQGTVIPLPLTHHVLAQLAAARRPTVTLAVKELADAGQVERLVDGSWLLTRAAEGRVQSIVKGARTDRSFGEILALRMRSGQTGQEARALRAEAKLVRAQGPLRDAVRQARSAPPTARSR